MCCERKGRSDDRLRTAREEDIRCSGLPRERNGVFGPPGLFLRERKCAVSGTTVHLTGAGSCIVTALQPGDSNYAAAPNVSRAFSIAAASCRVPKVVGKKVGAAKQTIAKRHCRTGKVGHAYSTKHKKGVVISQSRRPGRVLPARSKINLVVSRGRLR